VSISDQHDNFGFFFPAHRVLWLLEVGVFKLEIQVMVHQRQSESNSCLRERLPQANTLPTHERCECQRVSRTSISCQSPLGLVIESIRYESIGLRPLIRVMVYSFEGDIEDGTFLDVVLFSDKGVLAEGLIERAATSRLNSQRLTDTLL